MTYLVVIFIYVDEHQWNVLFFTELTELLLLMDKFGDLGELCVGIHLLPCTISFSAEICDRTRFYLQLLFTLSAERVRIYMIHV